MITNNATVTLTGNLGKAPEIRTNENGEYTFVSIATQDTFQDPSGYKQPLGTVWHRVAVYNEAIIKRLQALGTGKRVCVEATLDYYKSKVVKGGKELTIDEPKLIATSLAEVSLQQTEEAPY